jgi:ataxia telangiectasia mutated family protein
LLSVRLPFDLSLAYSDLPTISSIDEKMTFPGGINKPKLVTLVDSHGQTRRQLVKGKDDLRQDAVMQQFFRICNAFFQDAKATASRNLSIGTYFALPFSPSSGLLEWIDNTTSLEEFITDGNRKYHRATREVMAKLHSIQTKKGWGETTPLKEKKRLFEQCVKDLGPPRMARVFLRRFSDPGRWFEARLAYTRSVAVNSMAGHIIGLGDRHLSNILLSKATADVIHIDLGIAFEQGKLLRTPEQVPFRLTRNMVDAMGAPGVEGVMRRCCEEVLRVMRKHKEPIVTVLSVFIHDPLYTWSLAHDRVGKDRTSQRDGSDDHVDANDANDVNDIKNLNGDNEGNMDANRTLLVIKQKLEGRIGGDSTARGIEGQVQYLLQVRRTRCT